MTHFIKHKIQQREIQEGWSAFLKQSNYKKPVSLWSVGALKAVGHENVKNSLLLGSWVASFMVSSSFCPEYSVSTGITLSIISAFGVHTLHPALRDTLYYLAYQDENSNAAQSTVKRISAKLSTFSSLIKGYANRQKQGILMVQNVISSFPFIALKKIKPLSSWAQEKSENRLKQGNQAYDKIKVVEQQLKQYQHEQQLYEKCFQCLRILEDKGPDIFVLLELKEIWELKPFPASLWGPEAHLESGCLSENSQIRSFAERVQNLRVNNDMQLLIPDWKEFIDKLKASEEADLIARSVEVHQAKRLKSAQETLDGSGEVMISSPSNASMIPVKTIRRL